jgi:hypothetical protein
MSWSRRSTPLSARAPRRTSSVPAYRPKRSKLTSTHARHRLAHRCAGLVCTGLGHAPTGRREARVARLHRQVGSRRRRGCGRPGDGRPGGLFGNQCAHAERWQCRATGRSHSAWRRGCGVCDARVSGHPRLRRTGCQFGETVVALGLGVLGLLAVQVARSAACGCWASIRRTARAGAEPGRAPGWHEALHMARGAPTDSAPCVPVTAATESSDALNWRSISADNARFGMCIDRSKCSARTRRSSFGRVRAWPI